jgi:hypothetical protein
MSALRFVALLTPWLVVLTLLGASAAAERESEREEALRVFAEMRKAALDNYKLLEVTEAESDDPQIKGRTTQVHPASVARFVPKVGINRQVGTVPAKNIIKVWAVLGSGSRGKPGDPTDTAVSLTNYRWKPNQEFFLCLETTMPVHYALHANYKNKDEQVLPDPKNMKSQDAVLPGKTYVVPIALITDDTDDDELVTLTVTMDIQQHTPGKRITVKGSTDFTHHMHRTYLRAKAAKQEMRSLDVTPGAPKTSKNINDVAHVGICKEHTSIIQLKLKK